MGRVANCPVHLTPARTIAQLPEGINRLIEGPAGNKNDWLQCDTGRLMIGAFAMLSRCANAGDMGHELGAGGGIVAKDA